MKRAIIIHGWDQRPDQEWLPWLYHELVKRGWRTDLPTMPNAPMPKLSQWLDTLKSLAPDKQTVLIGHSLANALIMKYLEDNTVGAAVMVAVWDYLHPDLVKEHGSFFENGFDYEKIKTCDVPITIIQSKNDPYLDFKKAEKLAEKLNAKFIPIAKAGHFCSRDGYSTFPKLLSVVEKISV